MGKKPLTRSLQIVLLATTGAAVTSALGVGTPVSLPVSNTTADALELAMSGGSLIGLVLAVSVLRARTRLFAGISLLLALAISLSLLGLPSSGDAQQTASAGDQFWPLVDIALYTFIGIVFANALLITRGRSRDDEEDDDDGF